MPYINPELRKKYDIVLNQIEIIGGKGELEYCIYKLMVRYMNTREEKFSDLHDTVYAAQHCADEFRRRRLDKREDVARELNGDIKEDL